MEEIIRLVLLAQTARFTITALGEQFGISRQTGCKHLSHYAAALKGQTPTLHSQRFH